MGSSSHRLPWLPAAALLLLAGNGCAPAEPGPASVTATILANGRPVPGAVVELRPVADTAVTAIADSLGRARFSLPGANGPGILIAARDTAQPGPTRAGAPLLLDPGAHVELMVELTAARGHQATFVNSSRAARWARAAQWLSAIKADHYAAYGDWVAAGQPGELTVDWGGTLPAVRTALEDEPDPEVRGALWVALVAAHIRGAPLTPEEADRALRETPADAAIWAWQSASVASLVRAAAMTAEGAVETAGQVGAGGAGRPAENAARRAENGQELAGRRELADRRVAAYLDRVIQAYQDTVVQPRVLLTAMRQADAAGRKNDAVAYYELLLERHPDSREAELARKRAPGARLGTGDPVPSVPLPALDSTAPPITADELAGPATLVDFWAAWCTPCVAEMPVIHEAYQRFADRGFDVVSVSYDAYRDDVHAFRQQYPMPWRHAFVGAEALSNGPVARAYGITGLPFAVLVGPDGTLIALEGELRGPRLEETLERVLGRTSP